jgi:hypothetical protein
MATIAETTAAAPEVQAALSTIAHGILTGVSQKFNIAEVDAASGSMVDLEIDKIVLGSASIGELTLQSTSIDLKSGSAFLKTVQVVLQLEFTFDWWVNIGFWSDSGSASLGSLNIPVDVGDISVPSLNNIPLTIASMTTTGAVTTTIAPLSNVDLGGGSFTGLTATKIAVPANGFQLTGLGVSGVSVASVQVPQTTVAKVTVQDFHPNANVVMPSVQLSNLNLPNAKAADIQTTSAINFDADATSRGLSLSLGVVGGTIWVTPIAHIGIASLLLQGVTVSATIPSATIQNLSVPVDVRGINVSSISVGQVNVSNMSL